MKINFLENLAKSFKLGNNFISYDTVMPSNPVAGDLWFEPGAQYPQPWEYDSSNQQWMSNVVPYSYNPIDVTNSSNQWPQPVWFYNTTANRVKLLGGSIFVNAITAQTQGVNFYNFPIYYLLGTGAYAPLFTPPEDTGNNSLAMAANSFRRINYVANVYMPGNAWNISQSQIAYGTPGRIIFTPIFYLKLARP